LGTPLVLLIFLGTIAVFVARPLWQVWNVYAGAPKRRQFDASALGLQPPAELWPLLSELLRLGFKRLGEAQLDIAGIRAVEVSATVSPYDANRARDRHTVFAFIDESATVMAETGLVRGGPMVISFNAVFADGTVVETMYPRGESIHDPDFHSGHNKQSMEAALFDQRAEMDRWRMHHGSPRVINNMSDYLRADAEYRERFAKRKLWRPLVRYQIVPTFVAIGALMVVVWLLSDFWPF
jgi:hypothetical protein